MHGAFLKDQDNAQLFSFSMINTMIFILPMVLSWQQSYVIGNRGESLGFDNQGKSVMQTLTCLSKTWALDFRVYPVFRNMGSSVANKSQIWSQTFSLSRRLTAGEQASTLMCPDLHTSSSHTCSPLPSRKWVWPPGNLLFLLHEQPPSVDLSWQPGRPPWSSFLYHHIHFTHTQLSTES